VTMARELARESTAVDTLGRTQLPKPSEAPGRDADQSGGARAAGLAAAAEKRAVSCGATQRSSPRFSISKGPKKKQFPCRHPRPKKKPICRLHLPEKNVGCAGLANPASEDRPERGGHA